MPCFTCRASSFPTSFRSISRAMAKAASAQIRNLALSPTAPDWPARAALCETCPMRVLRNGISYCGTPYLQQINRDPAIDGCGCPTRDKAKSPTEHCPIDAHFRPAKITNGDCSCRWCARAEQRSAHLR